VVRLEQPSQIESAYFAMHSWFVTGNIAGPLKPTDFGGWLGLVLRLPIKGEEIDNLQPCIRTNSSHTETIINTSAPALAAASVLFAAADSPSPCSCKKSHPY
jgi:hypothetical protein